MAAHPETDIIISLIGLPADLKALKAWQNRGKPRFAFLFPDFQFLGGPEAIREAIQTGKLVAFVFNKPELNPGAQHAGKLNQEEFDCRFLLVNETNLDSVLEYWPGLFIRGGR